MFPNSSVAHRRSPRPFRWTRRRTFARGRCHCPRRHATSAPLRSGRFRSARRSAGSSQYRGTPRRPEFFTRADIDAMYRTDYEVPLQLRPNRGALDRPAARLGPSGRRRGRVAPSNIHDNAYSDRCSGLHRGHNDPARPRRAQSRRIRLPGHGGRGRPVEARAARAGQHGAIRSGPRRSSGVAAGPPVSDAEPDCRRCCGGGDGDGRVLARRDGDTAVQRIADRATTTWLVESAT